MDLLLFCASATAQIFLLARKKGTMGNSASKKALKANEISLLEPAMNGDLDTIKQRLLLASSQAVVQADGDLSSVLNQQDAAGNAGIHGAVFGGHLDVVEYLSDQGADLNLQNGLGCSPIWLAAGYKHASVLEFLVKHSDKRALLEPNSTGDSPLLAAASKGHAEICKALIEYATEKNIVQEMRCATNKSMDSPLAVAIGADIGDKVFDELCDPSILNLTNSNGVTPLLIACERDFPTVVQKLIDAGAITDAKDSNGDSILAVAAFCGSKNVVELLLVKEEMQELSLLNEASSKSGCTPLWLATRAGHADCVQLLLNAGADRTIANTDGLTPLQAAIKYKRDDMVDLLGSTSGRGGELSKIS